MTVGKMCFCVVENVSEKLFEYISVYMKSLKHGSVKT